MAEENDDPLEGVTADSRLRTYWLPAIIDSADDAIISKTLEGTILSWNSAAERIFGYTSDEIIGRSILTLIPPQLHSEEGEIIGKIRRGERIEHYETVRQRKDGTYVEISLTVSPIKTPEGEIIGASKIARDISQTKRIERQLRMATDSLTILLAYVDSSHRYQFVNNSYVKWFGVTPDDVIGKHISEILGAEAYEELQPELKRVFSGRSFAFEKLLHYRSSPRYVHGEYIPDIDVLSGKPKGFYAMIRDITENKRAEEERQRLLQEAEAASRAKDEFLAVLSHELRTPLNSIKGWVSLLRSGQLDDHQSARALEIIERGVEAQNALVADLLDVSRIISGKMTMKHGPVPLVSVVNTAVEALRPTADARGIILESKLDPAADEVAGDDIRLGQVVTNLVQNAIKFTPHGGRVTVKLCRLDRHARLTVTDTGIGIEAGIVSKVFDRFRQADSTSRRQHGGLGLGLSIAQHLVELHGGTISAESEGPGKGATFTVELPLAGSESKADLSAQSPPDQPEQREGELAGLELLIVEDDPDSLELLEIVLQRKGAHVTTATAAQNAIRELEQRKFHLVISDLGMAGTDGYDLIQTIRGPMGLSPDVLPAIALSGYASHEDRERAVSSGFQIHLSKPVDITTIAGVIRSLVSISSAGD